MCQKFWPLGAFSVCGWFLPTCRFYRPSWATQGTKKAFDGVVCALANGFGPTYLGKENLPRTQKSPGTRMIPGQEISFLRSGISREKLLGPLQSAHFPCVKPHCSKNKKTADPKAHCYMELET